MQEINNTKCTKWIILIVVAIMLFLLMPFLVIILIAIYFKTDLNYKKILRNLWIYDCFNIPAKTQTPWEKKPNSQIKKPVKKVYYDKLLEQKKKDSSNIKEKLMKELNDKIVEKRNKYETNNEFLDRKRKIKRDASPHVDTDKFDKTSDNNYNWWKSIWDDYVSVLDKYQK